MRRRDVFGVLAGPLAWPAASNSSAAQAAPFRRLAVLFGLAGGDADGELRIGLVKERMRQLGWEFGAKLEILAFYSGAEPDRIQANAKQAVSLRPDVLLTTNTPSPVAAMNATRDIPIVFVNVSDPIASGAALSLARPGGNATGFTLFETTMGGKWLSLLKEVRPGLKSAAALMNPGTTVPAQYLRSIESGAAAHGVELIVWGINDAAEIKARLFQVPEHWGVIALPDSFLVTHRELIVRILNSRRLPAVYAFRQFATVGGLLSYGVDLSEQYRQAASYIDRILRGAAPGELPIQAPNKFELIINQKTAHDLRISIPMHLLASADEVIE